jgi:hypothetical protein
MRYQSQGTRPEGPPSTYQSAQAPARASTELYKVYLNYQPPGGPQPSTSQQLNQSQLLAPNQP